MSTLKEHKVFSTVRDKNIKSDIANSKIWQECYTEEEVMNDDNLKKKTFWVYTIKFNGTKPVQLTKVKKIKSK